MMDDDLSYHLRFDKEFIENMPADFFAKIVTFPHAIPDLFAGFIKRYNPTLGKERHDFLDYHKEIVDEMQELRFTERQLREEYNDHHDSEYVCVEFLKKYPEYKQLISHIDITKYGTMGGPYEEITLDDFIDNIYYNPYLNEKKDLLKYGFEY